MDGEHTIDFMSAYLQNMRSENLQDLKENKNNASVYVVL